MKRLSSISIYREDQPSVPTWNRLQTFAAEWSRSHEPQMRLVFGEFLHVANIDMAAPAYAELRTGLAALERRDRVVITEIVDETPETEDLLAADFVGVQGISLDGLAPKSFSNSRSMGPPVPCGHCGSTDPWSRERRWPFVIDESLLECRAQLSGEVHMPPSRGWDFVNLPAGGGIAVSMRTIAWMNELGATGFETLPLISARTQRPSKLMVELLATQAFFMPCQKHSSEPLAVCRACGIVLAGALCDGWAIQRCHVGELSVWSRHPFRAEGIHLSRSLFKGLTERGAQGLAVMGVVMMCEHSAPGDADGNALEL